MLLPSTTTTTTTQLLTAAAAALLPVEKRRPLKNELRSEARRPFVCCQSHKVWRRNLWHYYLQSLKKKGPPATLFELVYQPCLLEPQEIQLFYIYTGIYISVTTTLLTKVLTAENI